MKGINDRENCSSGKTNYTGQIQEAELSGTRNNGSSPTYNGSKIIIVIRSYASSNKNIP